MPISAAVTEVERASWPSVAETTSTLSRVRIDLRGDGLGFLLGVLAGDQAGTVQNRLVDHSLYQGRFIQVNRDDLAVIGGGVFAENLRAFVRQLKLHLMLGGAGLGRADRHIAGGLDHIACHEDVALRVNESHDGGFADQIQDFLDHAAGGCGFCGFRGSGFGFSSRFGFGFRGSGFSFSSRFGFGFRGSGFGFGGYFGFGLRGSGFSGFFRAAVLGRLFRDSFFRNGLFLRRFLLNLSLLGSNLRGGALVLLHGDLYADTVGTDLLDGRFRLPDVGQTVPNDPHGTFRQLIKAGLGAFRHGAGEFNIYAAPQIQTQRQGIRPLFGIGTRGRHPAGHVQKTQPGKTDDAEQNRDRQSDAQRDNGFVFSIGTLLTGLHSRSFPPLKHRCTNYSHRGVVRQYFQRK